MLTMDGGFWPDTAPNLAEQFNFNSWCKAYRGNSNAKELQFRGASARLSNEIARRDIIDRMQDVTYCRSFCGNVV